MHQVRRAIIMAAGRGERLRPLTDRVPKPLIPVKGMPQVLRGLRSKEDLEAIIQEILLNKK